MRSSICKFLLPVVILLSYSPVKAAERALPAPLPQGTPDLHAMATRSGYVFAGTVKAVERIKPRSPNSVGVMCITFHVEHGYLGVRTGQTISIHEWAGLWQAGERYRAGERVVLFLYPPSKLGLTSPVQNGKFPVDSGGQVTLPASRPPSGERPSSGGLPGGLRLSPQDFELALNLAERE